MIIDGTRVLRAPREIVWETLIDPEALRNSMPGISEFNPEGNDTWDAKVTMGVGPIKGSYVVKIGMSDKVIPSHYKLEISGNGKPGWVNAEGTFDLADNGEKTAITYNIEAQVGGLVAGVGQRMLGGVAKMIFKQFFDNMEKKMMEKLKTAS